MPEIGATLREARMRARIDVSEIEAQTKIRAKYLRALENEEWSLLPGPTFVKSFLRTYAQALGLDGKALVEEYRLQNEHPGEGALEPIVSTPAGRRRVRPPKGPSRGYVATVIGVIALIVVLVVLLVIGGGSPGKKAGTSASSRKPRAHPRGHASKPAAQVSTVVALSLRAKALVYVCLLGDGGRRLIPGTELQPGETTPTYHAKRFEMTLGNSSVTLVIDGRARSVTPSSEAIGYALTKARGRQPLQAGHMPTCK
jgi:Helix-turn-helix domain